MRVIEKAFAVTVRQESDGVVLSGSSEGIEKAERLIGALVDLSERGEELNKQVVTHAAQLVASGQADEIAGLFGVVAAVSARGKKIRVKTAGQLAYIEAIKRNTVVIAIGPAGTGKTYLAVAMAVKAFKAREVSRIILTRPAVEAGEKLGFLPGDMKEKVDPYLRPLYDALYDMLGQETVDRYLERGVIEIAPLAFMRGRTLNKAVVILDEAQNATKAQMKMFLTRMGQQCRMIVTGDVTQIDLIRRQDSGLVQAADLLKDIDGISVIRLTESDVVRHPLVAKIIAAYASVE